MVSPRRVFSELITEQAEPGEEHFYGASAELIVEWREACADRGAPPYTLDWLRAERRRLELELRLIGVSGLTPPPVDVHGASGVANESWTGGDGRCDGCSATTAYLVPALAAAGLDAGAVGA